MLPTLAKKQAEIYQEKARFNRDEYNFNDI